MLFYNAGLSYENEKVGIFASVYKEGRQLLLLNIRGVKELC
jgi:hypothetical protein